MSILSKNELKRFSLGYVSAFHVSFVMNKQNQVTNQYEKVNLDLNIFIIKNGLDLDEIKTRLREI